MTRQNEVVGIASPISKNGSVSQNLISIVAFPPGKFHSFHFSTFFSTCQMPFRYSGRVKSKINTATVPWAWLLGYFPTAVLAAGKSRTRFDGPSKPRASLWVLLNFILFFLISSFFLVLAQELFSCHDIKCQRCCFFLGVGGSMLGART